MSYHNKIKKIKLYKQLDSLNKEWIAKSNRWPHIFAKAILQYNNENK